MNAKGLGRALKLDEAGLAAIRGAVAEAERRTSGEIAVAAIPESAPYAFHELFASVLVGAAVFSALLPFAGSISALIDRATWHAPLWSLPAFFGAASFAATGLCFLLANAPALDRLIVPRPYRRRMVYERALRHFVESGVYATRERTGVLIFVSCLEREVRVIADSGISARIEQADWDRIAASLARGIREGRAAGAIAEAVGDCGKLLEAHFPAQKENPNELPDGLVVLEAGS